MKLLPVTCTRIVPVWSQLRDVSFNIISIDLEKRKERYLFSSYMRATALHSGTECS